MRSGLPRPPRGPVHARPLTVAAAEVLAEMAEQDHALRAELIGAGVLVPRDQRLYLSRLPLDVEARPFLAAGAFS
jgi:hypothetical protein